MGERLRRELLRAVAIADQQCADELFFGGPDVRAYSATDGAPDAGTQHINRSNSHALHPAVSTALARAHINTDDAALSRADVAAVPRTDLCHVATDVGAYILTNKRTDDLADAAADSSPGARTVSRTNRAALEDANHSTLTTSQFYAFERADVRAVVTTLASADDAAVTCSHRLAVDNPETDVLWRQSAAVHGAHHTTFRRTHYFTFGRTDPKKNGAAYHRTDGLYARQNRQ